MGRFRQLNCLSRKATPPDHGAEQEQEQLIAARPVNPPFVALSKQRHANPGTIFTPPIRPPSPEQPPPNAMNNAVPRPSRGAGGGRELPVRQNYVEISDDEDEFDRSPMNFDPAPRPQPEAANPPRQLLEQDDLGAFIMDGDELHDFDDFDVSDAALAQAMMDQFERERNEQAAAQPPAITPAQQQRVENIPPGQETRIKCIDQVVAVFPGICRDYVSELYNIKAQSSDFLIGHIFESKLDKDVPYPKAKDTRKSLKRKREVDLDEEAARKYGAADRVIPEGVAGTRPFIRILLQKDFPETPMAFLDAVLLQCGYRLYSSYLVLEEAHRTFDARIPRYNKIKKQTKARRHDDAHTEANLEATIQSMSQSGYQTADAEVLRELQAARRVKKKAEAKIQAEHLAKVKEEKNLLKAQSEGTMTECECCCTEVPLNRTVHCDSPGTTHFFCTQCAKMNAETEIGNSKYILGCMSMDGCEGGFSIGQRKLFLDEKTTIALERNEQEYCLRASGIENLESCPFCPYAAEYPPVELNREFVCQREDCEKVSCRLCKLESHIPKSCEEHAKENGLSIRRQIEEAMSAALIRKCNKCETPFVKEEGCNKMTCTRNGCRNIQCYVCSKSCGYDHFDDTRRGGKAGNCPLFENVEDRHDIEVKKAHKEALDKARAEHPEYTEEDFKIEMSEKVKRDDELRKANVPPGMMAVMAARGGMPVRYAAPMAPQFVAPLKAQIHPFQAPGQRFGPPPLQPPAAQHAALEDGLFALANHQPGLYDDPYDDLWGDPLDFGRPLQGLHQQLPMANPMLLVPNQLQVPAALPVRQQGDHVLARAEGFRARIGLPVAVPANGKQPAFPNPRLRPQAPQYRHIGPGDRPADMQAALERAAESARARFANQYHGPGAPAGGNPAGGNRESAMARVNRIMGRGLNDPFTPPPRQA